MQLGVAVPNANAKACSYNKQLQARSGNVAPLPAMPSWQMPEVMGHHALYQPQACHPEHLSVNPTCIQGFHAPCGAFKIWAAE